MVAEGLRQHQRHCQSCGVQGGAALGECQGRPLRRIVTQHKVGNKLGQMDIYL